MWILRIRVFVWVFFFLNFNYWPAVMLTSGINSCNEFMLLGHSGFMWCWTVMHNDLHNLDKLEHRSGHIYSSDVQSGWDRNVTAEKNPKIINWIESKNQNLFKVVFFPPLMNRSVLRHWLDIWWFVQLQL